MTAHQPALTSRSIIPFLADIFARRGAEEYLGEPVTIGEHMLQAAHFAAVDGQDDDVVIAALLHDIGHFTGEFIGRSGGTEDVFSMEDDHDRLHEQSGAAVLAQFFPALVVDCCRYHVAAKRYLCACEPQYFDQLSPASVHSLALQGGPMQAQEADDFASLPHFDAVIAVRRYDEAGKVGNLAVPSFDHYIPMMQKMLSGEAAEH